MKKLMLPLMMCVWLGACTPSMTFQNSSVVPAATGKVQTKRDKNNNYVIRVDVRNLAPADRLTPPQRTYVVWMESGGNSVKKLGLLEPSKKALEARLTTTAVTEPNRIFITAENNPEVSYPAGAEVLATNRR